MLPGELIVSIDQHISAELEIILVRVRVGNSHSPIFHSHSPHLVIHPYFRAAIHIDVLYEFLSYFQALQQLSQYLVQTFHISILLLKSNGVTSSRVLSMAVFMVNLQRILSINMFIILGTTNRQEPIVCGRICVRSGTTPSFTAYFFHRFIIHELTISSNSKNWQSIISYQYQFHLQKMHKHQQPMVTYHIIRLKFITINVYHH